MTAVLEAPRLLHKNVPVSGIKVLDEAAGIVEAYVSGIGNKDSTGDIIMPGAFDGSLARRTPKGVWSHDWARWVAKTLEVYEVKIGDPRLPLKMSSKGVGGLYVKMQFNLETQDGREAFSNVKFFGEEAEWSIGYMELDTEYSKELVANLLKEIDLYEYSPVLFGANNLTSTVSVKVDHVDDQYRIQVSGLGDKDLEAQVSKAVADALAGEKKEDATTTVVVINNAPEEKAEEAETEEKVVPGSMEAHYSALMQALSEQYPNGYTFPVATFTDSVVYEVFSFSGDEAETGTFQATYTLDDAGSFTFGEPKAVDVVEVVVEKSGGVEALEAKGGSLEALKSAVAEGQKALFEGLVEKAGRVLSVKNQDRLSQAKGLIDEVLSSGEKAVEEEVPEGSEEKEAEVEIANNEPVEVEKSEETDEMGVKELTAVVRELQAQLAKLTAVEPEAKNAEVKADEAETEGEEKEAGGDRDDHGHRFEAGADGQCIVCGLGAKDEGHIEEDASEEASEKADDVDINGADLLASLTAELDLVEAFLPAS